MTPGWLHNRCYRKLGAFPQQLWRWGTPSYLTPSASWRSRIAPFPQHSPFATVQVWTHEPTSEGSTTSPSKMYKRMYILEGHFACDGSSDDHPHDHPSPANVFAPGGPGPGRTRHGHPARTPGHGDAFGGAIRGVDGNPRDPEQPSFCGAAPDEFGPGGSGEDCESR